MAVFTRKITACCFSLAAFAVAIISGLLSDVPTAQILLRAVLSMVICYPIGFVAGMLCEYVVVVDRKDRRTSNVYVEKLSTQPNAEQIHSSKTDHQETVMNAGTN